ncbi:MAG: peptidase S8, partial [Acidimicrobiia bacterium]|nr:peptidase S8 [Acidimicrobiia bacterium]
MPRARKLFVVIFAAAVLSASAIAAASANPGGVPNSHAGFGQSHKQVCQEAVELGVAHCDSDRRTAPDGLTPAASTTYTTGYAPADLASAYKYSLPVANSAWAWNGQTVAIVDAYDNPNTASDLAAYRTQFGLPACTTASGCFTKINQNGAATPLPSGNTGWGQEISL